MATIFTEFILIFKTHANIITARKSFISCKDYWWSRVYMLDFGHGDISIVLLSTMVWITSSRVSDWKKMHHAIIPWNEYLQSHEIWFNDNRNYIISYSQILKFIYRLSTIPRYNKIQLIEIFEIFFKLSISRKVNEFLT